MQIVNQLVEIVLLKRKPQDIAYSPAFLSIAIAVLTAVSYLTFASNAVYSQPLAYSVVSITLAVLVWYLILTIARKTDRFVQSASAFVAITIVHSVLVFVLFNFTLNTLFILLIGLINGWMIFISLTIFSVALDRSKFFCILVLLVLNLVPAFIAGIVFPDLPVEQESVLQQVLNNLQAQ